MGDSAVQHSLLVRDTTKGVAHRDEQDRGTSEKFQREALRLFGESPNLRKTK